MQTYFYNLSGGINQAVSKTALGLDTKKLYWADSKNIEILQNTGIIRQNGNTQLFSLDAEEEIIGLHQLKDVNTHNILVATAEGNIYIYQAKTQTLVKINKTIDGGAKPIFADFLDGVVCGSTKDGLFYINNDTGYEVEDCNLKDFAGNYIYANCLGVYKGRIWVASGAAIYYSALGTYNDFETENDAGYINNFHTDTNKITALKTYKDYLAIYKENSVYLLSGTTNEDFTVVPFADKGTASAEGVVTVNNKQYFINQGIFTMEQAGLLSQIQLGDEISLNIKAEFANFDKTRFDEIISLQYESKNQIWFFIPYQNSDYLKTIWIYSYVTQSWFKRVIPQNITTACISDGCILTADTLGKVYKEDFGNTFNGAPIEFMWKSPFITGGDSNVRKTIEEFYFVLDESYDNNFNFSVYKNFDSESKDDEDAIYSANAENVIWGKGDDSIEISCYWNSDTVTANWAKSADSIYKAEISESNYSVQLCVEGSSKNQGMAIIGLEFKEIFVDDV